MNHENLIMSSFGKAAVNESINDWYKTSKETFKGVKKSVSLLDNKPQTTNDMANTKKNNSQRRRERRRKIKKDKER
jgi:hypothetical protein